MDCPAKDRMTQDFKQANEKKKYWELTDKKREVSARVTVIPFERVSVKDDPEFEQVAPGKFRKVY